MYFSEDQVTSYFRKMSRDLVTEEEGGEIVNEVMKQMPSVMNDYSDLNEIICTILTSSSHRNKNFDRLAVRLLEDLLYKDIPEKFSESVERIQQNRDAAGREKPLLCKDFFDFVMDNRERVDELYFSVTKTVPHFEMTSFGLKTLARSYLLKTHEGIMERPNHLWFRVSLFLNRGDWGSVARSFEYFRRGYFIHATPTLFHAGLVRPQMASCFLVGTDDSVAGIFKTIGDAAQISKWAGGIGIHISNIRAKNSYIHGTNGVSNGIMPMLKVYNDTSRYIDQCFEGSVRVYTESGFVPIREIQPGVKVLTTTGVFERVLSKNRYWKKDELVRLTLRLDKDLVLTYLVTKGHDFYIQAPAVAGLQYESLEDMRFNSRLQFVAPVPDPHIDQLYTTEDCFCLGFIYRHGAVTDFGFRFMYSQLVDAEMYLFLDRNYPNQWTVTENSYTIRYNELLLPEKVDTGFFGQNDFPAHLLRLPVHKLEELMKGWNLTSRQICSRQISVDYVLKGSDWSTQHQILKMEKVERQATPVTVYDLVVENNPCYQTDIGMVHNGGGKRNGAFAMYIEPWHADIYDFVLARRNIGNEDERARDLFYALWIPDLFMRQVENGGKWYLMSPDRCPGLSGTWGDEFEKLYWSHVEKKDYEREIMARDLWVEILKSQIETGVPYMLYKDSANSKSNQQNLGTIRSSNLCCEIIEYSDNKEYAVCNLASLSLPKFVKPRKPEWKSLVIYTKESCSYCKILKSVLSERNISFVDNDQGIPMQYASYHNTYPLIIRDNKYAGGFTEFWNDYLCPEFDFGEFGRAVSTLVNNLNRVIDLNAYPLEECRTSNLKNRPIGIGVQGLADLFFMMRIPYDGARARQLNHEIFEALYFYALQSSTRLAQKDGHYESFPGSPLSQGRFHFDLCESFEYKTFLSPRFDWEQLRQDIRLHGTRNSLLVAPMPTASTSQILGNTESFEPLTNNLYLRRTSAGEFYICNHFLVKDLNALSKWDNNAIEHLIVHKGSVQQMDIPAYLKQIYRTVWEIPQKSLIDMAAERQFFIDQSQSFNIYLNDSNMDKLNKIHFYGWKKGLKTGSYYIRSRAPVSSQNYTIDPLKERSLLSCEACSG